MSDQLQLDPKLNKKIQWKMTRKSNHYHRLWSLLVDIITRFSEFGFSLKFV